MPPNKRSQLTRHERGLFVKLRERAADAQRWITGRVNVVTHPLLQDILAELAEELRTLFQKERQPELASQVAALRIFDRCRCGDDFCATFYTAPKPKGSWSGTHETIPLDCEDGYLNIDLADGKIVCVEVLYRDAIRDKLLKQLP